MKDSRIIVFHVFDFFIGELLLHNTVAHGILFQRAGFCLDANIYQRFVARAFGIAAYRWRNPNDTARSDWFFLAVKNECAFSAQHHIYFLVLLVMMEKWYSASRCKCAERHFHGCCVKNILGNFTFVSCARHRSNKFALCARLAKRSQMLFPQKRQGLRQWRCYSPLTMSVILLGS